MRKTLLPILAVGFLVAAGCASTNTDTLSTTSTATTATPLPNGPLGKTATPQVLVAALDGSAEPNIAAAKDGTLYIANPGALWRSDDGGKTWSAKASPDGGGDGDIALDDKGNLYWLGLFGDAGPIPFQVSHDKGATWSTPIDVSDGTGSDREWIFATPQGGIYTTWRGSTGLEFRHSPDGGDTWDAKITAAPDGNQGPVVHHDGRTYLVAADFGSPAGGEAKLHVYTSLDDGATWTATIAADVPVSAAGETNGYITDFPVLAADANGTLYLVYSANIGAAGQGGPTPPGVVSLFGILMVRSYDGGATWSEPLLLSDPTKDARMPWVAAGAPGRIAVVWYENVVGVPGESIPDLWNVQMWHSINADAASPASATVMLTSEPNHIGALCTSGTGCLVSDRSLLDFFEVAITPEGQPVATWANSVVGTGVGVAVQGTDIYFGGIADAPRMA